ncbi:MAG: hypothetical protein M1125_01970 [Candidatus Marsarchaeota archaeon]|nr:hypothetical protein [Candidatus Marsarchaeota archaeon]
MHKNDRDSVKMTVKMDVKINDKITDNNDKRSIKEGKNTDKKQKLLSDIISYFFDSAEKNNLDNKKVNKVVKDVQYLVKKDPKQRDTKCFICEKD